MLVNYDVGFVTSSPMNVKGDNSHQLFKWLKKNMAKYLNGTSTNICLIEMVN